MMCTDINDMYDELVEKYCKSLDEITSLKQDMKKLLDVIRPVAVIGNKLEHNKDIWEFLSPNGYRKAYEVFNEINKKYEHPNNL